MSLQWNKYASGLMARVDGTMFFSIHRNLDPSIPGRYVLDLRTLGNGGRTVKVDRGLSFANDVRSLQFEAIELLTK